MNQDPIGLSSGQPNLFAYPGDPNNLIDPLGLRLIRPPAGNAQISTPGNVYRNGSLPRSIEAHNSFMEANRQFRMEFKQEELKDYLTRFFNASTGSDDSICEEVDLNSDLSCKALMDDDVFIFDGIYWRCMKGPFMTESPPPSPKKGNKTPSGTREPSRGDLKRIIDAINIRRRW